MKKNRIMTLLALAAGGTAAITMLNKYIKVSAVSKNLTSQPESLCFKWRLGNIHYTKTGNGKPILLLHDLNFASSSYEWNLILDSLSHRYTIYAIDLLGCGRSEKPNLTYTNYLFVQLICDFIKAEIGHRANVIATGESASLAVMACNHLPDLFDQLILVNPDDLFSCSKIPGNRSKCYKFVLDLPLIGTLLYHIASSKTLLNEVFTSKYFYNPYSVKASLIDHYYESAHLGAYPKAIFASQECFYTKCNLINALKKIDNSIFLIGGAEKESIQSLIERYKLYNPAIESILIPKTKELPQLENPEKFLEIVSMFFA